jgi:hypothetical protein
MEPLYDKMRRVAQLRDEETAGRENRRREESKYKLKNIIEKKFKTTFIGALSCFEEEFGFLWGHGKQDEDLKERWERARTKILNNGNNQARAVLNELQQYLVNWQGYTMNLPVRE